MDDLTETQPDTWCVVVTVPMHVDREALFDAVADAAHDWEPENREGWDIEVFGAPTAEVLRSAPRSDR
jgi:hypothetical protein